MLLHIFHKTYCVIISLLIKHHIFIDILTCCLLSVNEGNLTIVVTVSMVAVVPDASSQPRWSASEEASRLTKSTLERVPKFLTEPAVENKV